ncbi:hypothetical protein PF005_g6950 [Phytophthora fragariae]|uniref:Uncharacterized protein n=1 Tax=Phytophthora fragariae TaxID=53985 RepID=A0A6A3YMM8_9STRA|nr:hypothetical protein PF003_g26569 [Phytophthora fragariae]KAE8947617.1 hypothetical protein PF009_g2775 [Phytophthora fragariae]KAE9002733.1 hypothetical protein PF011_g13185 [Phytophthora fragariae]KAE9122548.1 hypothetical protein PF007_g7406 [Phytophthora fragariae]KAE9126841.1 hypothetical protein PF010_g5121 [Phytophthora fragariae]
MSWLMLFRKFPTVHLTVEKKRSVATEVGGTQLTSTNLDAGALRIRAFLLIFSSSASAASSASSCCPSIVKRLQHV